MVKVAIQGYQASFHDVAAHKMLGDAIEIVSCDTFVDVFKAADFIVILGGNEQDTTASGSSTSQ